MCPAQPSFLSMNHQSVCSSPFSFRTTFSLGLGLGSWRGGRRSMGRGSVQLTFSKRRVGLLKKAHEISVLCGANVALIIFSSKGNLYEYLTESSMDMILERYKRYSYAEKALPIKEPESQEELCHEYGQLKRMVDALQRSQSHVMGENLDTLTLTELQQLELQLETTLKHIRSQMNQLLLNSISELQKKEKSLIDDKILLKNKIIENKKAIRMAQQMQAKEQSQDQPSSSTQLTLLLINSISTTLPSWMFTHSS